jgi:UDP-GlcNAc3NAcA epimerase
MRIATVVGARPQYIKAATISRVIRTGSEIEELLIHTGQHYDEHMSDVFFEELEIPKPDYRLGVGSGAYPTQTGPMLEAIERVLLYEKPDWVLVYGDTNSTLAGALAAAKLHIPVAHVEAGLRSFNQRMLEEINRVLTDHASDLLFAPTDTAVENLRLEGIARDKIRLVGDVMYDAALYYGDMAEKQSSVLEQLGFKPKGYALATVHRAENTEEPARLWAIVEGLERVAQDMPVVLPLHPRTRERLDLQGLNVSGVTLIEPVGYLEMVMLEKNAIVIATDSGGVQKEASFYRVPCVTLRDETEWVETVDSGWNRLASPDAKLIYDSVKNAKAPELAPPFYGDGMSAQHIVRALTTKPSRACSERPSSRDGTGSGRLDFSHSPYARTKFSSGQP